MSLSCPALRKIQESIKNSLISRHHLYQLSTICSPALCLPSCYNEWSIPFPVKEHLSTCNLGLSPSTFQNAMVMDRVEHALSHSWNVLLPGFHDTTGVESHHHSASSFSVSIEDFWVPFFFFFLSPHIPKVMGTSVVTLYLINLPNLTRLTSFPKSKYIYIQLPIYYIFICISNKLSNFSWFKQILDLTP